MQYTISAVYNDGLASNDRKAETLEEAKKELEELKQMDHKAKQCGGIKKGETVEYSITKWLDDEYRDFEDILYETITY